MGHDERRAFLSILILKLRLRSSIHGRVILVFRNQAQANQHPQAIGLRRKGGDSSREQKNLVRSGYPDDRKLLERLTSLGGIERKHAPQASAKLIANQPRAFLDPSRPQFRKDSSHRRNFGELFERRRQDIGGTGADAFLKLPEGLLAPVVGDQVSNVFVED